jgi:formate dehydrogenase iron-sulfur subunit
MNDATLWNPKETSVGGTHAFFIVRGDARNYNLPPNPQVPTVLLKQSWSAAAVAAGAIVAASLLAFAFGSRNAKA